jgi:hypothetical protein
MLHACNISRRRLPYNLGYPAASLNLIVTLRALRLCGKQYLQKYLRQRRKARKEDLRVLTFNFAAG